MRSATQVLSRLRSQAPVTVATPLGVIWLSGIAARTVGDFAQYDDAAIWIFNTMIGIVAGAALLSFVDRLFRMPASNPSWWIFGSLTFFALLMGAGPMSLVLGNPNHDYPAAAVMVPLALMLGCLACRELVRLRGSRRKPRLEHAV